MKITPPYIRVLDPDQVFVFGSNLAGRHGAGAALTAFKKFGAIYHQGSGPMGHSYAIPTRNGLLRTLPLLVINQCVREFIDHAKAHADQQFLVTPVGCGLAGYQPSDIAPMFSAVPSNVWLPESFVKELV